MGCSMIDVRELCVRIYPSPPAPGRAGVYVVLGDGGPDAALLSETDLFYKVHEIMANAGMLETRRKRCVPAIFIVGADAGLYEMDEFVASAYQHLGAVDIYAEVSGLHYQKWMEHAFLILVPEGRLEDTGVLIAERAVYLRIPFGKGIEPRHDDPTLYRRTAYRTRPWGIRPMTKDDVLAAAGFVLTHPDFTLDIPMEIKGGPNETVPQDPV